MRCGRRQRRPEAATIAAAILGWGTFDGAVRAGESVEELPTPPAAVGPALPDETARPSPKRPTPPPPVPDGEEGRPTRVVTPAEAAAKEAPADPAREVAAEAVRQYYTSWRESTAEKYYYKLWYFKVEPTDEGFVKHYVVNFPTRPDYYYFYDPVRKQFWGRLLRNAADPERRFSLVPAAERKAKVADIPEPAYPEPGPLPILPGASDRTRLVGPTDPEAITATDPEPDVPVGTVREVPGVRVDRPTPRYTFRVGAPTKAPYRTETTTTYEDRWVDQITYTTILVNGVPRLYPVNSGYWTKVPVTRTRTVPNE